MKILHLTTYESGGAGKAVSRLHQGLIGANADSQMLVQKRVSDEDSVVVNKLPERVRKARMSIEFLPTKFYPRRKQTSFSTQWLPERITTQVSSLNPDIIHLHWINHAFVQIETLAKLGKPIVWTLHDMWPFTGGCHYSENCKAYQAACGCCPILKSNRKLNLSALILQRKHKAWKDLDISVVAPSRWLADCAKASSLFEKIDITVIPHGLNLQVYSPTEKVAARQQMGLPTDKTIVLFGALNATKDTRKGFALLAAAIQHLSHTSWKDSIELVVFGASKLPELESSGFGSSCLGHINNERQLALAYSAADVMVVPSTQEAFGQTAFEALACGTPVVAFDTTGLKDIVSHTYTGYLAKPFSTPDLAKGITWIIEDTKRHKILCAAARRVAEREFSLSLQAARYLSLYEKVAHSGPLRSI